MGKLNREQYKVANRLQHALDDMKKVGLVGGVYEGLFCIWPRGFDPHQSTNFFEAVEERGEILYTASSIDGGAGV